VAQQTVDTAQAAEGVALAQVQAAKEKLDTLAAQQLAATQAADDQVAVAKATLANAQAGSVDILSKKAEYQAAVAAYNQGLAQVSQQDAALAQAQANLLNNPIKKVDIGVNQAAITSGLASLKDAKTTLNQTTVRAPANGVVLIRNVSQGTIIPSALSATATGTDLMTIGETDRMYVQATVDETDIANIDEDQKVEVSFDAYSGVQFDGTVTRIDPQAVVNQNVTQFDVRVEIDRN
jgi:HlyD family secretion protein